jgi:hypothetical protein
MVERKVARMGRPPKFDEVGARVAALLDQLASRVGNDDAHDRMIARHDATGRRSGRAPAHPSPPCRLYLLVRCR